MTAPRGAGKVRRLGEQPLSSSTRGAVIHTDRVEAQGEVVLLSHRVRLDRGYIIIVIIIIITAGRVAQVVTGFPLGGALLKHLSSASLANR